ncbi:MAG TPA: hypothetical protein IAB20_12375 [Candidatus Pullichristensenella excrementipullorum]|nr:hypothetical protein [Candidatus Pullichristensenella excrementipullorum]
MKKLLCVLAAACLLLGAAGAFAEAPAASAAPDDELTAHFAEAPDFSALSDDELIAQLAALQSEIVARDIEKTATLTAGTYIGGRDIPAGDYILASAGEEGDAGIVSLRSVDDPEDEYPSKLYEFNFASEGYTVYITVEEGDELVVPYPYTLTVSAGVKFE